MIIEHPAGTRPLPPLEWCKKRARFYLDRGELGNALAGLVNDLTRDPETAHIVVPFETISTVEEARAFVESL